MNITQEQVVEEIAGLPYGFDDVSDTLRTIAAILRLRGFSIMRADDAKEYVSPTDDIASELGYPSIWLYAKDTLHATKRLRQLDQTDPEYVQIRNNVIRQNLDEQARLIALLESFYSGHQPGSSYSRLVVKPIYEDGEFILLPQGADSRVILDEAGQKKWFTQAYSEITAFGDYLSKSS